MAVQLDDEGNYVLPITFDTGEEFEAYLKQVREPLQATIDSKVKRFRVTGMLYLLFGAIAGWIIAQVWIP